MDSQNLQNTNNKQYENLSLQSEQTGGLDESRCRKNTAGRPARRPNVSAA